MQLSRRVSFPTETQKWASTRALYIWHVFLQLRMRWVQFEYSCMLCRYGNSRFYVCFACPVIKIARDWVCVLSDCTMGRFEGRILAEFLVQLFNTQ